MKTLNSYNHLYIQRCYQPLQKGGWGFSNTLGLWLCFLVLHSLSPWFLWVFIPLFTTISQNSSFLMGLQGSDSRPWFCLSLSVLIFHTRAWRVAGGMATSSLRLLLSSLNIPHRSDWCLHPTEFEQIIFGMTWAFWLRPAPASEPFSLRKKIFGLAMTETSSPHWNKEQSCYHLNQWNLFEGK